MEFIPSREAYVVWDFDDDSKVRGVRVKSRLTSDPDDDFMSPGICACMDWKTGYAVHTPKSAFEGLEAVGFSSNQELLRALREFSQIAGCDWAKERAAALEERDE